MALHSKTIANGVKLHCLQTENFKEDLLSFNFSTPLCEAQVGLGSLLFPVLLRGCRRYPTLSQMRERLADLFAAEIRPRNTKLGRRQLVGLSASFLKGSLTPDGTDTFLEVSTLLRELLFSPVLDESGLLRSDAIEGERHSLLHAIAAQINNKTAYAKQRCLEQMYADDPYRLSPLGTEAAVQSADARALTDYMQTLLHTAPIDIFYVGAEDPARVAEVFSSFFAGQSRTPVPLAVGQISLPERKVQEICEEISAEQSKLVLGFRNAMTVEQDSVLCRLFDTVYSSSPNAKLFMNVREKLSLCYYCSGATDRFAGALFVQSGIDASNKDAAVSEILLQLKETAEGKITDAELDAAKRSCANDYRQMEDSPHTLEGWYLPRILCGREETLKEAIARLDALTAEQVAEVAGRITLDTVYLLRGKKGEVE